MILKGKNIISTRDLKKQDVEEILQLAEKMLDKLKPGKKLNLLSDKILACLFFEPSTRTRLSFTAAMQRLGGSVLGFSSGEGTSLEKGETLPDTVKTVERLADCIVIRHPANNSAKLTADNVRIPVINAGDGSNQHPTQALLDLFTIKREKGLKNVTIALCGDLKYGRTVHSLVYLLAEFGLDFVFVSPKQLRMPAQIVKDLYDYGVKPKVYDSIQAVISKVDVLYVTRIQKERFPTKREYEKLAGSYRVDKKLLEKAKKDLIVMHPLPRVNELSVDVDSLPCAKYFDQVGYGVAVRMALLALVFGKGI